MDGSIIKIEIITSIAKARTMDITARPEKRGKNDAFTLFTTYGGSMYHRGQRRRHVKSAMNRNDDGSRRRV